uniref:Knottin scorpion toxin-like domain-containing protein n=1 Tax=Triticum urartu TaxID=4572 RepID=A0A8R7PA30_TRIUA
MGMAMAMGAKSMMKKSLLLILFVCPLTITVTDCAKEITPSVPQDPPGNKICGAVSKTWPWLKFCGRHDTCNKPCRAEGFEGGCCGMFPFVSTCCCTKHCLRAAPGQSVQPVHKGDKQIQAIFREC